MLPTFKNLYFHNQTLLTKSITFKTQTTLQKSFYNRSYKRWSTSQTQKYRQYNNNTKNNNNNSNNTQNEGQSGFPPLVVLVAWLGARERYFDKYVELWKSLGYETLSVRSPIYGNILPPFCYYSAQQTIEKIDVKLKQQQRPVIFHVFSNGGFIYLANMLKVGIEKQNNSAWHSNLRGVVFDSCPGTITSDVAAKGVLSAILAKSADQVEIDHKFIIQYGQYLAQFGLKIPLIQNRLSEVWHIWNHESPICKQLYHYSAKDLLIPYQEVENFMGQQKDRGCEVIGYNWKDSEHVAHYRSYPQQYRNSLFEFANKIND